MPIYYKVQNSDDSIVSRKDYPVTFNPDDVAHKFGPSFEYRIIPEVIVPPSYDPATQYLGAETLTVQSTQVDKSKEVLNKTQEQLDDEADFSSVQAVLQDMKNGVGSPGDRITRLEKVVSRLAKERWL